jgi:predicted  nucleic acid-binding Zn-ribbon protein
MRIDDLRAEARYRRERLDLYRAKMYGQRPTTMTRLRELERESQGAEERLRRAEQEHVAHGGE